MSNFRSGPNRSRNYKSGPRRSGPRNNNQRSNKRGAFIHPSKFVNQAKIIEEVAYKPTHTFADFGFQKQLQANIDYRKFLVPSAIQDQSIKLIQNGQDVVGLANTGTGKTAAFVLPLIDKLIGSKPVPTVLILAPTRELAIQINDEFKAFSSGLRMFSALAVGGVDINRQIREIKRGQQVIIGTPGRIKDLINRKVLRLQTVQHLVLDEADRMLDMGFINDIRYIIEEVPTDRQTLFFSATITPTIQQLIGEFLKDPIEVSVRTAATSDMVDQNVLFAADKNEKIDVLLDLLNQPEFEKTLVFGETKFGVQRLCDHLGNCGIPSVAIHGNKSQAQRQRALKEFKNDKAKVMVATDVAARGLDIPNVSHVINFDQPMTYEDYVHRIGRTGRGGKSGKALTFVHHRDKAKLA